MQGDVIEAPMLGLRYSYLVRSSHIPTTSSYAGIVSGKKNSTKSCLTLAIPRTVAHQAPLSMEFSRQEYWSGLPFPSPGDLPDPGIEARSPELQADALPTELNRAREYTVK